MGVYMCTTVIATFFSIAIGLLMFYGGVPQMGTVTEGGGGVSVSLLDIAVTTALSKNEGMMDEAVYMATEG